MSQVNTVAGMVTELVGRFRNLEPGHAAVTVYAVWRDMCEETHCWRHELAFDTTDGQKWFTLAPNDLHADIQMIYQVFINGTNIDLSLCDYGHPPTLKVTWATAVAATGTLPTQDNLNGTGLVVDVSLLPWLNDPLGIPSWKFGRFHAAVYEGCCAKLCLEFPRTYQSEGIAQIMAENARQRYVAAKAKIRLGIEQDNDAKGISIQSAYPFFVS